MATKKKTQDSARMTTMSVYLTQDTMDRLKEMALSEQRSVSRMAAILIERMLDGKP